MRSYSTAAKNICPWLTALAPVFAVFVEMEVRPGVTPKVLLAESPDYTILLFASPGKTAKKN